MPKIQHLYQLPIQLYPSVISVIIIEKMLAKTEIMIFTKEIPEKYLNLLDQINPQAKIFVPKALEKTVSTLIENNRKDSFIHT